MGMVLAHLRKLLQRDRVGSDESSAQERSKASAEFKGMSYSQGLTAVAPDNQPGFDQQQHALKPPRGAEGKLASQSSASDIGSDELTDKEAYSGTGTPLEAMLAKTDKVKYKNSSFRKNSGKLNKTETKRLMTGQDNIASADCSTFAVWALAQADSKRNVLAENITLKGARRKVSLSEIINIRSSVTGFRGRKGESDSARSARKKRHFKTLVKGNDDRIQGAATAFEALDIGSKVDKSNVCPGDFIQSYSKNGGHTTVAHKVRCRGAAIFGMPGSPKQVAGPKTKRAGPQPLGFDGNHVVFILDETTDPKTVGQFQAIEVAKIGCHSISSQGADDKFHKAGVYTSAFASVDKGKMFVGRLSSSVWANHKPAHPLDFHDPKLKALHKITGGRMFFPILH